jgi:phage I-like protein
MSIADRAVNRNPQPPEWIELIPAGTFAPVDDRGPFINDDPDQIIQATLARMPAAGLVIDYDHSTDFAAPEGRPAPAAGWIKEFKTKGGAIFARVEWTRDASEALADRKWRYISPVFEHDQKGRVLRILRAALTNNPSLIQLRAVAADGAAGIASVSVPWVTIMDSEIATMAEWDTKYINDLPDSAFAYIEPGGHKDAEGKTVPRSKRHFPLKNKNGNLDPAHVRNALARAPQSPFGRLAMKKIKAAAKRLGIGEYAKKEASAATMAEEKTGENMKLSEIIAALEQACPDAPAGKLMRAAAVLLDDDDGDEMQPEIEAAPAPDPFEDDDDDDEDEDEEHMARRHAEEMAECMTDAERAETAARHAREREEMARKREEMARKREAAAKRLLAAKRVRASANIDQALATHPMVVRMAAQINELRRERTREAAIHRVDAAIRHGRLVPSQRDWAISYCTADPAGFQKFLAAQPQIIQAGADGTLTARVGDAPKGEAALSEREIQICANLGLESKEQLEKFAANKERWTLKFPRPRLMLDDTNGVG